MTFIETGNSQCHDFQPDPLVNPVWVGMDGRRCVPTHIHFLPDLLDLDLDFMYRAIQEKQIGEVKNALHEWDRYEQEVKYRTPLREIQPKIDSFLRHIDGHPIRVHPFLNRLLSGNLEKDQMIQFIGQYAHVVENTGRVAALCLGKFQDRTPANVAEKQIHIADFTEHLLTKLILFEYSPELRVSDGPTDYARLFRTETALSRFQKLYEKISGDKNSKHPMFHGTADFVISARLLALSDAFTESESLAATAVESVITIPFVYSVILAGILRFALQNKVPIDQNDIEYLSAFIEFTLKHSPAFLLALALNIRADRSDELMKQSISLILRGRFEMFNDFHRQILGSRASSLDEMDKNKDYPGHDNRIESELLIARQQTQKETITDHESYKNKKNNPFSFKD